MKTRFTILLLLLLSLSYHSFSQINICQGGGAVIAAVNTSSLTNPSYSMNPGGFTSVNGSFTVNPVTSTTYTLYVTGLNTSNVLVTTTSNTTIVVSGATFSLTSAQNFSLGCGTKSICVINVVNAQTYPVNGAPVTYTFLPPTGSLVSVPPPTLSTISSASIAGGGVWSIGVMNVPAGCITWTQVNVSTNTVAPAQFSTSLPPPVLSCNSPSAQIQCTVGTGLSYNWLLPQLPPNVISNMPLNVSINGATPSNTLVTTPTLQVIDNDNLCSSFTTLAVYQNIFPPNAAITSGPASCQSTVMLTNTSTTGIPPAFSSSPLPVVASLWQGPAPQQSQSLSTTYVATVAGIYSMTATDLNNGCQKTATINVITGATAAFMHTISAGQVTFNDASINTGSNTTFFWNFGDGNSSTLQNPVHTYSNAGVFVVKLKIVNVLTLCSDSSMQALTITGVPCSANAGFSMAPTSTPQVWTATPASPWNISAATWSWGDGSSSNTLYTSHQYSAAGMYNICLSVTVSCAASASSCTSYSVYRASQAAQIIEIRVQEPELISGQAKIAETNTEMKVLPNPNSGEFILKTPLNKEIAVSIHNLDGSLVYQQAVVAENGEAQVRAPDLSSGVYILSVRQGGAESIQRIVIIK